MYVLEGTGSLVPALAYLSPAFWIAWILLVYSGDVSVGSAESSAAGIIGAYLISTMALVIVFFAGALIPVRLRPLLNSAPWMGAAGVGAALTTAASLAGWGPLFTFLTGICTGLLALRFCCLYAELSPKNVLIVGLAAQILASFIYGYTLGLPASWRPVVLCLLPIGAFACSFLTSKPISLAEPVRSEEPLGAPFVRFAIGLFVVSLVINVIRGYYPLGVEMDTFAEARGASSLLFQGIRLAILTVVFMLPLSTRFVRLCHIVFLACCFVPLLLPLLGRNSELVFELFGCINALLNWVLWALLASMAFRTGRSALRLFGWGYGSLALGSVVGWLVGYLLYQGSDGFASAQVIDIALVVAVLAAARFLLNRATLRSLFAAPDDNAVTLAAPPDPAAAGDEQPAAAEVDTGGARSSRMGVWRRSAAALATDCDLSDREREVFERLLKGEPKRHISDTLFISYNTVRSHVRSIYTKCGVHSEQELLDLFETYRARERQAGKR